MASVATDKTQIKFYVTRSELRDELRQAAADDMRSVSTLIETVLTDWLKRRGYTKSEGKKRDPK
jgi:hypothetical protein